MALSHSSISPDSAAAERATRMRSKAEARRLISEVLAELVPARQGKGLRAIILTGSLARDEATILVRGSGFELLGDADLLLVYGASNSIPDHVQVESVLCEAEDRCLERGLRASVHAGAVSPRYLQKLPKSIFAYELRHCAKVIWGEPEILTLIPEFAAAEIPHEDAWRMISNRMIELMDASRQFMQDATTLDEGLHYATVKMFLDLATSYLVFAGEYRPSYRERGERLLAIANSHRHASPFRLARFAARVQQCTVWKLSGELDHSCQIPKLWQQAIRYLRRLWRWEIAQITVANEQETIAALIQRLAKRQSRAARLRGWVSVAKGRGWLKSWRRWPRWMQQRLRTSPRYLVYGAAAELVFRLPCLIKCDRQLPATHPDWDKIRGRLPEVAPQQGRHNIAPWQTLADDIAWNYAEFLVRTHA